MDFDFTEEQQAVAELARKILEDRATNERLKAHEASGAPFDAALWDVLAEANLLGTAIPEGFGGAGLGFLALCRLLEEVGRSVAPVPAFPALVLGALPVARFGSEEQKREFLPKILRGELFFGVGYTEPGAGPALASLADRAALGQQDGLGVEVAADGAQADLERRAAVGDQAGQLVQEGQVPDALLEALLGALDAGGEVVDLDGVLLRYRHGNELSSLLDLQVLRYVSIRLKLWASPSVGLRVE